MFHLGPSAAFQHVEETDQIAVDVRLRMVDRITHARLGREMDYPLRSGVLEEGPKRILVGYIGMVELETLVNADVLDPVPLEIDVVVVAEIVQPGYPVTFSQQALAHMKSDEAGRAGHKHSFHC